MTVFRRDTPVYFDDLWSLHVVFEILFTIYMLLQFFKEYTPEFDLVPVRDIKKISYHYLTNQFKWDFLPLIPFQYMDLPNNSNRLFFLIKMIRLYKGIKMFDVNAIMTYLKK